MPGLGPGIHNYFLPFLFGACVSADAATLFTAFGVFGSLSSFDAFDATDLDVVSDFFAIDLLLVENAVPQLHPVVLPHVSHFKHVPFRTSVKFMHSGQASPT